MTLNNLYAQYILVSNDIESIKNSIKLINEENFANVMYPINILQKELTLLESNKSAILNTKSKVNRSKFDNYLRSISTYESELYSLEQSILKLLNQSKIEKINFNKINNTVPAKMLYNVYVTKKDEFNSMLNTTEMDGE